MGVRRELPSMNRTWTEAYPFDRAEGVPELRLGTYFAIHLVEKDFQFSAQERFLRSPRCRSRLRRGLSRSDRRFRPRGHLQRRFLPRKEYLALAPELELELALELVLALVGGTDYQFWAFGDLCTYRLLNFAVFWIGVRTEVQIIAFQDVLGRLVGMIWPVVDQQPMDGIVSNQRDSTSAAISAPGSPSHSAQPSIGRRHTCRCCPGV